MGRHQVQPATISGTFTGMITHRFCVSFIPWIVGRPLTCQCGCYWWIADRSPRVVGSWRKAMNLLEAQHLWIFRSTAFMDHHPMCSSCIGVGHKWPSEGGVPQTYLAVTFFLQTQWSKAPSGDSLPGVDHVLLNGGSTPGSWVLAVDGWPE